MKIGTGVENGIHASSVYAGNMSIFDPVGEMRKDGQKRAMQVISEAWNNDQIIDDMINVRRKDYYKIKELEKAALDECKNIEKQRAELTSMYGIDVDSEEYQNLLLLEKRQNYQNGDLSAKLSEEELELLREIDKEPKTEYQSRMLELNGRYNYFKKDVETARLKMQDDVADIKSIKNERLKSHGMVDAQKNADKIREMTSEEITGMLMEEAKEQLDSKMEEIEEKAEELHKEKDVVEKQQENLREKLQIQEALQMKNKESIERAKEEHRINEMEDVSLDEIMNLIGSNESDENVKSDLEKVKSSMKLLEVDLQGIKVDEII